MTAVLGANEVPDGCGGITQLTGGMGSASGAQSERTAFKANGPEDPVLIHIGPLIGVS